MGHCSCGRGRMGPGPSSHFRGRLVASPERADPLTPVNFHKTQHEFGASRTEHSVAQLVGDFLARYVSATLERFIIGMGWLLMKKPLAPPPEARAGLTPALERNIHALVERQRNEQSQATLQQKVADAITAFTGS